MTTNQMNGRQAHNRLAEELKLAPDAMHARCKTTARRAAAWLKEKGFRHEYCHSAWQRGMRWYAPGSDVPESDERSYDVAIVALVRGAI